MFALQIEFRDELASAELIFVRRPLFVVGASQQAHVEIEDMRTLNFQLHVSRELGRKFRCKPVALSPDVRVPELLEGVYEHRGQFDLGPVRLTVHALDSDLILKETEPPDRAGVRVLRQACALPGPLFPALVVPGEEPIVMSFVADNPIYIGKAKFCALRLDAPEIAERHARIGYEAGEFWVEDLGSTAGTFVNSGQISGRVNVPVGAPVTLGRSVTVVGVTAEDQLQRALHSAGAGSRRGPAEERRFPVLVSVSEVARPARLVLPVDASLTIGRDPTSDLWLGAPHVSRRHCALKLSKSGTVVVSDHSTNGTAYDDGLLRRGDVLELRDKPKVLDFGAGVTLAICFDEEQEQQFRAAGGAGNSFKPALAAGGPSAPTVHMQTPPVFGNAVAATGQQGVIAATAARSMIEGWLGSFMTLTIQGKIVVAVAVFTLTTVLMVIMNLIIRFFM